MSDPDPTMYCLVTGTSRQSLNSIQASRDTLRQRGVDLRTFQITHKFSRRIWRYWRTPFQDCRCLASLVLRDFNIVILNPGTSMIARPTLLRLMLLIGRVKGVHMIVRWGSCAWLLENSERRNVKRFRRSIELFRREGLLNLVLSPQAEQDLKSFTHLRRTVVVGNACSLPRHYESPSLPDDDPPLIVNVASLQRRKGPDLFIDVAFRVCAEHPTVRFVWVGAVKDRTMYTELQQRIEARGLRSRIEFVGHVDPPFEWIRRASALMFTSRSEAFGLVVAEAMACYRTVICFAGTGAEFAVGNSGEVVPRFDVDSAADRVLAILGESPFDRINSDARKRYETNFSPDAFSDRLCGILAREMVHEVTEQAL